MANYKDVSEFKSDRSFLDYSANLSSYLEGSRLEFIEERIMHETRMAREGLQTDSLKTQIRRHFLIRQLFGIYKDRTKPEDRDPEFAKSMKAFEEDS